MNDHELTLIACIIFERDGKTLLLEKRSGDYVEGHFDLPQMGIEVAGSPIAVVIRSIVANLGVSVERQYVSHVHTMYTYRNEPHVYLFFVVREWEGEISMSGGGEFERTVWVSSDDLPQSTVPFVRWVLESINFGKTYSELGDDFVAI
jgi:hypothetical protein